MGGCGFVATQRGFIRKFLIQSLEISEEKKIAKNEKITKLEIIDS